MKIRKPLKMPQAYLVSEIQALICKINPHLMCEFDFGIMNPVIQAVDKLKLELSAQGDCLFRCDCDVTHDDDCELKGTISYDPAKKHRREWALLTEFIRDMNKGRGVGYVALMRLITPVDGIYKSLLTEALDRGLIYRDKDELFYKKNINEVGK